MKYLAFLLIIPLLVWLKGDISLETILDGNQVDTINRAKEQVKNQLQDLPKAFFTLEIDPVSTHKGFSGAGIPVNLYDQDYNLLSQSQVINGKVKFTLFNAADTARIAHAIVPSTKDEVHLQYGVKNPKLRLHEAYLAE